MVRFVRWLRRCLFGPSLHDLFLDNAITMTECLRQSAETDRA